MYPDYRASPAEVINEIKFTEFAVAFLDIQVFNNFIEAAERAGGPAFDLFYDLPDVTQRQLDFTQSDDRGNAASGMLVRAPRMPGNLDFRDRTSARSRGAHWSNPVG